jgi:hypothetical protein
MTTQHNTHKASNHLVDRSSYIHKGTYQLGFSISPLMSALSKDDFEGKRNEPIQVPKSQEKANTRQLEMIREKCMLQPKTLGTKGSTKAKHTRRVTTPTCNPEKPSNQNAHLKINLLPLSKTLITLKPNKGQK